MKLACFGRHLICNVITASFATLKNSIHNPIQMRRENVNKCLKRDKYELLVSNALNFFLMTEDDLKFGTRYLQWLLYRAISFFSGVKRSSKAA